MTTKAELRKKRELEILSKLDKGGIMTIDQLMALGAGGLDKGSRRNALRVLREMEKDGLVTSKNVGRKLFSSDKGSRFGNWEHTLMRNNFLIQRGVFDKCKMEIPVKRNGKVELVADAGWQDERGWILLEVDRKQKLKENRRKIKVYKELGVRFEVVCYKERTYMWKGCVVHEL